MEFIKNIVLTSNKYQKDFTADIFYTKDQKPKPVVIFSHGFKSFKDWGPFNLMAESFAGNKFIFLKFNFPFNGTTPRKQDVIHDTKSFRKNNFIIEIDNLREVIDWVQAQNMVPDEEIDKDRIFLLGHSQGGVISMIEALNDDRVKKVAAWAPFKDFEDILVYYNIEKWKKEGVFYSPNKEGGKDLPMDYSFYDTYLKNKDLLNVQKTVKQLRIPILIVHGTDDEIARFEDSLKMKEWNTKIELNILPLTGHLFGSYHPYTLNYLPFDLKIATDETMEFFDIP